MNELSHPSFWRRRLADPLIGQLKQGATPERLATSLAWGATLGLFPILGTTTTLCGVAGVVFKLNHIALQVTNWLVYPLQIILIIPFLRLGNLIFGHAQFPLSLQEITELFATDFTGTARNLAGLALRGIIAWALVAVPSAWIMRQAFLPPVRHLAENVFTRRKST